MYSGVMRLLGVVRLLALVAIVLSACSPSAAAPSPAVRPSTAASAPSSAAAGELTIYAAASLRTSFKDLAAAYSGSTGIAITLSFDSSAMLEAQIEQGAPADILASADTANPAKLVAAGLASGSARNFAGTVLAIIVPSSGAQVVTRPADLARAGVKVIGAGDLVPITTYATQLIANLAKLPGYPAYFQGAVTANIVSREENVQAVISKIELGEGDAGIVYATDARASAKVRTIEVPAAANVQATYAAVAVKASRNLTAAQAFLSWLTGAEAQAILAGHGFLPPG